MDKAEFTKINESGWNPDFKAVSLPSVSKNRRCDKLGAEEPASYFGAVSASFIPQQNIADRSQPPIENLEYMDKPVSFAYKDVRMKKTLFKLTKRMWKEDVNLLTGAFAVYDSYTSCTPIKFAHFIVCENISTDEKPKPSLNQIIALFKRQDIKRLSSLVELIKKEQESIDQIDFEKWPALASILDNKFSELAGVGCSQEDDFFALIEKTRGLGYILNESQGMWEALCQMIYYPDTECKERVSILTELHSAEEHSAETLCHKKKVHSKIIEYMKVKDLPIRNFAEMLRFAGMASLNKMEKWLKENHTVA